MTTGPLSGLKVVEIAALGPAPCAGMMFADMGAEVIVVERLTTEAASQTAKAKIYNRGKKSVALDLKVSEGAEIVRQLIDNSDILIEGFRPGVMERLGLGPEASLKRNPRLVYGRMTGWGQYGPLSPYAGHDPNFIALSGALWYGGRKGSMPTSPLSLVGDLGGGTMVLAWGILCTVINAQQTGEGQVVDAAITDGSAYISTLLWSMYGEGQLSKRFGENWQDGSAPWNQTYACKDNKFVTVCAFEDKFYRQLIECLGLADHSAFSDQWDESRWLEGKEVMRDRFLAHTRDQWCEVFSGYDACFTPVLNFEEASSHPHNVERGTFVERDGVVQPAPAPQLSGFNLSPGRLPEFGEHSEEVLLSLGYDSAQVTKLRSDKII